MEMRGYSKALVNQIQQKLESGQSVAEVAAEMDITKQSLYQTIKTKKIHIPSQMNGRLKDMLANAKTGKEAQYALAMYMISRKGVKTKLRPEDILPLPNKCPILGIQLDYGTRGQAHDATASIDKLIPELGYSKGNVAVLSRRANRIKNDATLAELKAIVSWMEQQLQKFS